MLSTPTLRGPPYPVLQCRRCVHRLLTCDADVTKTARKRKKTFPLTSSAAYFLAIVDKVEKIDDAPNPQWPWRHSWDDQYFLFDEDPGPIPMGAVGGMYNGGFVMVNPADASGKHAAGLAAIAADIAAALIAPAPV